jgi:hypothetical protein
MQVMADNYPTLDDVLEFNMNEHGGPWNTKSNGELNVSVALPLDFILNTFLKYNQKELSNLDANICGIRIYTVSIPEKDSEGGGEFHKVRYEFLVCTKGEVIIKLEDLHGNKKTYSLNKSGIAIPSHILHDYISKENDSEIMVLCNTLFFAENNNQIETISDTYPKEEFYTLQKTI